MGWAVPKRRHWYTHWALWCILFLGAAIFFAWPRLKGRWQRWNAGNQVRRAERLLAEKDGKHAVMTARGVLAVDPMNVGAIRIIAEAMEAAGIPEAAQWRSRLDTLDPGNPQNLLAWAADTLKAGDLPATERVLAMLAPASRENATYHGTAARLALAKRDNAAAERHWAEAMRLEPAQDGHRLASATLRIQSEDREARAGAAAMLTALGEKSPRNLQAIRVLLNEAIRAEEWKQAEALSKTLAEDPGATFGDKLLRLATLRKLDTQEAPGYLLELRNDALTKPDELYTLLMWMNENSLPMLVSEWARALPRDVIGAPPVCVAVADAYARSSEWQRLREFLDERAWADFDYLRRAFLSRSLEKLEEADLSAQEWKDGLSAARSRQDSAGRLERLAKVAVNWGWEHRAEDVMWMLASSPGCPRWILEALWAQSLKRSDTALLQKLAGMLAQTDSKSVIFRNNHAFFSLLVRSEDGNPHREAEKLCAENPGNATIAVTRGLSLYQQGKATEAAALTGSLPFEELKKPQIALYHAIFLTAAGETAKAAEFLLISDGWKMLPEEETLLERAKLSVAKALEERGVAEAAKAAMAARAAREVEGDQAVEAARAARAAQAAKDAEAAAQASSARK